MSDRNIILVGLAALLALAWLCAGHLHRVEPPKRPVAPAVTAPAPPSASAPISPALLNANLVARWRGDKAVLTGALPSAEIKAAVVARAQKLLGAGNVEDRLTIAVTGGKVTPTSERAGDFFPPDLKRFVTAEASFDGATLTLVGEVDAESAKVAAEAELRAIANAQAGLKTSAEITLAAAPKDKDDLQARLNREVALATVEFKTGSSELTPVGRAILDRVAKLLVSLPGLPVAIIGHTDNQGNEAANVRLSAARANSVKLYLARQGVAATRMSTSGVGGREPIASNDTDEGRQRNRRIAFKL